MGSTDRRVESAVSAARSGHEGLRVGGTISVASPPTKRNVAPQSSHSPDAPTEVLNGMNTTVPEQLANGHGSRISAAN